MAAGMAEGLSSSRTGGCSHEGSLEMAHRRPAATNTSALSVEWEANTNRQARGHPLLGRLAVSDRHRAHRLPTASPHLRKRTVDSPMKVAGPTSAAQ